MGCLTYCHGERFGNWKKSSSPSQSLLHFTTRGIDASSSPDRQIPHGVIIDSPYYMYISRISIHPSVRPSVCVLSICLPPFLLFFTSQRELPRARDTHAVTCTRRRHVGSSSPSPLVPFARKYFLGSPFNLSQ